MKCGRFTVNSHLRVDRNELISKSNCFSPLTNIVFRSSASRCTANQSASGSVLFSIAYIDRIIFVEGNGQSEIVSSMYTGEKINEKERENKQLK
jgi:hypothetical protein